MFLFLSFNEQDCSFSDARQYKGSVVRLRVLSASLDPKQARALETESQSELCSTQSVQACVLIRWHEMSVVSHTIALCVCSLFVLLTSGMMSWLKDIKRVWSHLFSPTVDSAIYQITWFVSLFTTADSNHVQIELCGMVTDLIKSICCWWIISLQ